MNINIGERIRNLREDSDLTQTQLAKKLNITQRKLSYIENNKYEPSMDDIREICRYFNISADYFLGLPKGLRFPD